MSNAGAQGHDEQAIRNDFFHVVFNIVLLGRAGANFDCAAIEVRERWMKMRALGNIRMNTREPFGPGF